MHISFQSLLVSRRVLNHAGLCIVGWTPMCMLRRTLLGWQTRTVLQRTHVPEAVPWKARVLLVQPTQRTSHSPTIITVLRISCAVSQSNAHLSAAVMVFQTMEHGMKRHQAAPDVLLY